MVTYRHWSGKAFVHMKLIMVSLSGSLSTFYLTGLGSDFQARAGSFVNKKSLVALPLARGRTLQ